MSLFRPTSRTNFSAATKFSSKISLASTMMRQHMSEFGKFYVDLCNDQHVTPLHAVTKNLDRRILDLNGDRIKYEDWFPLAGALRWDKTLTRITIRLRSIAKNVITDANMDLKARVSDKHPALTTKCVLTHLVESLRSCLSTSSVLTAVELEGLPLKGEYVQILAQGLLETQTLQHLSLAKCSIEDNGVEIISLAVRNVSSIMSLNFSGCDMTDFGAECIANLINVQKLNRYSDIWKETLRYREPDIDVMPGLRRLTLNNNPEIGDRGVEILLEALKDDLWLRALDLQNTGITDEGATLVSRLIRTNPNLVIVDVRANREINEDNLAEIMRYLVINNADKMKSEFKWLPVSKLPSSESKESMKNNSTRLWTQRRTELKRLPISSSSMESYTRKINNNDIARKVEETSLKKENEVLRLQLQELNGILHAEILQKLELIKENQQLKESIDRCEAEKKDIEEKYHQASLDQNTIKTIQDALSQLVTGSDEPEDTEVSQLLQDLKFTVSGNKLQEKEKMLDLNLNPEAKLSDRLKIIRNNEEGKVILEEEEDNWVLEESKERDTKRKMRMSRRKDRRRKEIKPNNTSYKKEQERSISEAQRIFAELTSRSKFRNDSNHVTDLTTNSEDETSL